MGQTWSLVMVNDHSPISFSSLTISNRCPWVHSPSRTFCQQLTKLLSPCQHQHHFLPKSHSFLLTQSGQLSSLSFQSTSLSFLKSTHKNSSPRVIHSLCSFTKKSAPLATRSSACL